MNYLKQLCGIILIVLCCSYSISLSGQPSLPLRVCDITALPIDGLEVITYGKVVEITGDDRFLLQELTCDVLCDDKFGNLPEVGMWVVVEGRIQVGDPLDPPEIDVRRWVEYGGEPPLPGADVYTVEDAVNSGPGNIALLLGHVESYSDPDAGLGTFTDETGSMFIDFPNGDSPEVLEEVYAFGHTEIDASQNIWLDVAYWYPEDEDPPPPPPPIVWEIEEANASPPGTYCFIQGMVTSWTDESSGEGIYEDGDMIAIDFESDLEELPELMSDIFAFGVTREDSRSLVLEAHEWINAEIVGLNEFSNSMEEISIYPNPASDYLNIDVFGDLHQLTLFNTTGQILFQQDVKAGTIRLDLTGFQCGLYFVSIESEEGTSTRKVVIK